MARRFNEVGPTSFHVEEKWVIRVCVSFLLLPPGDAWHQDWKVEGESILGWNWLMHVACGGIDTWRKGTTKSEVSKRSTHQKDILGNERKTTPMTGQRTNPKTWTRRQRGQSVREERWADKPVRTWAIQKLWLAPLTASPRGPRSLILVI